MNQRNISEWQTLRGSKTDCGTKSVETLSRIVSITKSGRTKVLRATKVWRLSKKLASYDEFIQKNVETISDVAASVPARAQATLLVRK